MTSLDFSAFQSAPSARDVIRAIATGPWQVRVATTIGSGIALITIVIALAVQQAGNLDNNNSLFFALLFGVGIMIMFSAVRQTKQSLQISAFATANNGLFINNFLATGTYQGVIFGSNVVHIVAAVRTKGVNSYEIGNYRINGANGPKGGYVRMSLHRKLPHMLLSSSAIHFGVPGDIGTEQHLSLEGNFDKHFKLYAPKGYERDALYIFTPDIMELFMTRAGDFTCEIIDDQLFLYARSTFPLTKPELYPQLIGIIERIGNKFENQIDGYKAPATANNDNRLKSKLSASDIILLLITFAGLIFILSKPLDIPSGVIALTIIPVIGSLLVLIFYLVYAWRQSAKHKNE